MSDLENVLYSCGILQPLQQLVAKQKDVNIWNIHLFSLNAFANKTGMVLEYKAAIKRRHKFANEEDENMCAQRYSSPETDTETAGKLPNFNGNNHFYLDYQ